MDMDPIDRLLSISASWDIACEEYIDRAGAAGARAATKAWALKHCARRMGSAAKEAAELYEAEHRRVRSVEAAVAVRTLKKWRDERGDSFFNMNDVLSRLEPALDGIHPRTAERIVMALERFGLVDKIPGRRGTPTVVRLSEQGAVLYDAFCNSADAIQSSAPTPAEQGWRV